MSTPEMQQVGPGLDGLEALQTLHFARQRASYHIRQDACKVVDVGNKIEKSGGKCRTRALPNLGQTFPRVQALIRISLHYGSVSVILQRIDYGALAGTGRDTLSHVNHILVLPRVFRVNIAELAVQINIGRRRALDLPAK